MNNDNNMAVIILAAGLGTRMKSEKAKVLHEIAGKCMISYVLDAALGITSCENIVVVIGCQAEAVRKEALKKANVVFAYQYQQLGTGHAVSCAMDSLPKSVHDVIILCGDMPFISRKTIQALIRKKREDALDIVLLAARLDSPKGYGRIIFDNHDKVLRIVEESDASSTEKAIQFVNAGTYCVDRNFLESSLLRIKSDNVQKELYLTDIIEIAVKNNRPVGALILDDAHEVLGINSLEDLDRAARSFQKIS